MSYGNITVAVKCKIQLVKVIVFTQATVVKTTEVATSVASNVAMAMWNSAYVRQGVSYQCRDTDPDPDIDSDPDLDRHQNFMQIVLKFLSKVANKQTDRQTTTKTYPPWLR